MSDTITWKPCETCGGVALSWSQGVERCATCGGPWRWSRMDNPVRQPMYPICGLQVGELVCCNAAGHRANGGRDHDGHYYVRLRPEFAR